MYKQNPLLLKEMFINYNPSGTLEDGSKPSSAGILVDIQTLKEYKQQLKNYKQELDNLNAEIKSTQKIADKVTLLEQKK